MSTLVSHLRAANYYYDRNVRQWMPSLLIAPLAFYLCLNRGEYTLLDHAALLIHEAGHFFFALGGDTLYLLGGSLMQVLLPLVIALHFLQHMYRPGIQVALFWLGHNLLNISVYVADAQVQQLPLLGGEAARHDWTVLLKRAEMLEFAPEMGSLVFLGAISFFGISILLPMLMWGSGEE